MRSMAETYGHLLPLVRTTCLRRPVVSATICFVSVLKNTVVYFRWCAQHVCTHRFNQLPFVSLQRKHHRRLQVVMDASGADKLILLVQTNQVLYDKSAAEYKVKDALEKSDIWQIGVDIAVNSERTTDLRCRFSFLVSRWRCDRSVRFLVSRFSFLVSRFSFLGGGVTGPYALALGLRPWALAGLSFSLGLGLG